MNSNKKITTRMIASVAVCGAVSFVLMMLDFPLPIVPSFVKFDFSELPALICGFAFGPIAGVLVELIKNLLHLFMTTTAGVGELSNFILGCCLTLPASIIYKRNKNRRSALLGMLIGTLCFGVVSLFSNYLIMFPFYENAMGFPLDAIIKMGTDISPVFDSEFKIIALSIVPFNILKGLVISLLTFLLYKRLRPILRK